MPNTSATGGYLAPAVASPPVEDASLDALFQAAIVGVTGLAGNLVRPRWQPNPPRQPEPTVSWCALGVTLLTADAGPYISHDGTANSGLGQDTYVRHEDIAVDCTFYGPAGQQYAAMARDGFCIPQNMEGLRTSGVFFVDSGDVRSFPELVNQQWIRRYDLSLKFRRQVNRGYQVENLLTAPFTLTSDTNGLVK